MQTIQSRRSSTISARTADASMTPKRRSDSSRLRMQETGLIQSSP